MGFLSGVLGAATGFLTGGPAGAVIGGIGGLLASKENQQTLRDLGTKAGGWLNGMGAK